jgi:hypothetical protein
MGSVPLRRETGRSRAAYVLARKRASSSLPNRGKSDEAARLELTG